jgi:hypothetical protein
MKVQEVLQTLFTIKTVSNSVKADERLNKQSTISVSESIGIGKHLDKSPP